MSDKLRQELHERLAHIAEPGKPLLNRVGPDYIDPLVQVIWECIQDRAEAKEAWRQRLSMAMDGWEKADKDNQALRARVAELEAELTKLKEDSSNHHAAMANLVSQIVAHERACAGTWVPVGERLPDEDRAERIVCNSNGLYEAFLIQKERAWYIDCEVMGREKLLPRPTHWLDARLPTSSGEEE